MQLDERLAAGFGVFARQAFVLGERLGRRGHCFAQRPKRLARAGPPGGASSAGGACRPAASRSGRAWSSTSESAAACSAESCWAVVGGAVAGGKSSGGTSRLAPAGLGNSSGRSRFGSGNLPPMVVEDAGPLNLSQTQRVPIVRQATERRAAVIGDANSSFGRFWRGVPWPAGVLKPVSEAEPRLRIGSFCFCRETEPARATGRSCTSGPISSGSRRKPHHKTTMPMASPRTPPNAIFTSSSAAFFSWLFGTRRRLERRASRRQCGVAGRPRLERRREGAAGKVVLRFPLALVLVVNCLAADDDQRGGTPASLGQQVLLEA